MPKMKTQKSAAKRYKLSGSGKLLRRKAFKAHLLTHKSAKRMRSLEGKAVVHPTDVERAIGQLPYVQYLR